MNFCGRVVQRAAQAGAGTRHARGTATLAGYRIDWGKALR
jgi:hypothetical protein